MDKKKEILDNLELPTYEVEMRIAKELSQEESDKQSEFYYESKIIPAGLLRPSLGDASIFFNILIEMLDSDYHYDNKFESFIENEIYKGGMVCRALKNFKVEYIGEDNGKEFLLVMLTELIRDLDYARIKLFITDEREERRQGDVVYRKWKEYQEKKQQKEKKSM